MDGYCAYIAFPTNYKKELEKYFHEASKTQIFSRYNFYWITNSHFVPPDFSWYDFKKKEWQFNWRKWLDEILNAPVDLPEVLKEENSRIMVDKKDLILIKELEKNAMINFKKLAETLKITPQSVGARYQNHIIQRKLVIEYIVDIYPFPAQFSDLYNFIIDFKSEKALAKFVNASDGKPFIVSYAKIMGRNSLIVNIYILKEEFPNLIKSLNQLYRAGLINSLFYVTLDPTSYRRQTISYEFFNDGKWSYDAEAKMKKLKEISELH